LAQPLVSGITALRPCELRGPAVRGPVVLQGPAVLRGPAVLQGPAVRGPAVLRGPAVRAAGGWAARDAGASAHARLAMATSPCQLWRSGAPLCYAVNPLKAPPSLWDGLNNKQMTEVGVLRA